MSRPPYPLEITSIPIQLEGVWTPEPVWTVSRETKSTARARIRTPNYVIPAPEFLEKLNSGK
jgi:hypothetical protein